MTTYNGEMFLSKQLDSILSQDYAVSEIIVCDDCSSDSTIDILEKYKKLYPNLFQIYKNEKNLGYVKNFEKSLSFCTGDFIALSDQDDLWDNNKISTLLAHIQNYDLIHSDARLIDKNENIIGNSFTQHIKKQVGNQSFLQLCANNPVTGCTAFFTKALLQKALPMPDFIMHDQWLALFAKDNNGITYYPASLVSYRQHENNAIGGSVKRDINISGKRKIDAVYKSRSQQFEKLFHVFSGRLSNTNLLKIQGLQNYYASYFLQKFRFKAVIFYILNLGFFSYNKNFFQITSNFFRSFVGISNINTK